jgi:hypothetical protein
MSDMLTLCPSLLLSVGVDGRRLIEVIDEGSGGVGGVGGADALSTAGVSVEAD